MSWHQLVMESAATSVESWVVLSAVTKMSIGKYAPQKQKIVVTISAFALAIIISILNLIQTFSFVSIILCIAVTIIVSKFLSNKAILHRTFSTFLAYFAVHTVDYMILFIFGMMVETPITNAYTFTNILEFGTTRCWFLFVDKSMDVLLYIILKRHLSKLQRINRRYIVLLLTVVVSTYTIMTVLLSLVLSDSLIAMQMAIIFSWLFMFLCVCITLCFLFLTTKYQEEKARNELLAACNAMMEKNYQRLHTNQQATARLIHDFNHHMCALRELSRIHADTEITKYLDSLLETHYHELPLCKSGNSVIDAIINCKIGEAQEHHIHFSYRIHLVHSPDLPSVDLCSILANLIDNAFDACKQIDDHSQRVVDVHIWQNSSSLYLFQVMNTVEFDPFLHNPQLHSTKTADGLPHGIGLKSIQDTAEKYGGTVQNRYHNGKFFSTVFLNLEP